MQRHVLYIEDEAVNVLLMQEVFRLRPNWRLTVAGEGAEGVGLAIEEPPDLILVDMNLPDMSGLQVIEQLRASEATRYLPCIALSADALREQIDVALRAGFDEYWTKPIDIARRARKPCQRAGGPLSQSYRLLRSCASSSFGRRNCAAPCPTSREPERAAADP
jgi:CheY-like chemotaxis protein